MKQLDATTGSSLPVKLRKIVGSAPRLTQRQQWAYMQAADDIERLEREVAALRSDMERGMANHNADLNASVASETRAIGRDALDKAEETITLRDDVVVDAMRFWRARALYLAEAIVRAQAIPSATREPYFSPEEFLDFAKACSEMSMVLGNPALIPEGNQTLESELMRHAAARIRTFAASSTRPTQADLLDCFRFWQHYATLNEDAQDEINGERYAMLERMENWAL